MATDSKQFDGTLGNAKEIAAWVGEGKACFGPGFCTDDAGPGAVNLIESRDDAAHYIDVPAGSWVVKSADGPVVFSDQQYRVVFPA